MEIKDGILHARFKAGTKMNIEQARMLIAERLKLCEGKEYPFVIYDGGVISMDREARVYLSSHEGTQGIMVAAFIEQSAFSRLLINFFLNLTKPRVRSKAFSDVDEALEWIHIHS